MPSTLRYLQRVATGSLMLAGLVLPPGITNAQASMQLTQTFVEEKSSPDAVSLVRQGYASSIVVADSDFPGVKRAAGDLQADVQRVSGVLPTLLNGTEKAGSSAVIVGTIGKSPMIDALVASGKLQVSFLRGQWESFVIATVKDPAPGVANALVIAGSDRRGTIYGIYEVSEQIGVSPWYWFADVPTRHRAELFIKAGVYIQGPPAVKYRGIFINDEDPSFSGWARRKFGGINSRMYANVFELLLRLRANYMWPAMWGKAFNEDDPNNPVVADEYGIVMGTSHHEPLMRAQAEWDHHRSTFGNGEWNYATNKDGLQKFWTQGVARNHGYENLYTIGMRGDGDLAMPDAGGFEANKLLLEQIMHDQRQILANEVTPDVSKVPQLWALFTEVQKYYDGGLKVPADVTLLFTDDNMGNLRRVPTPEERKRPGGSGVYYHMDMNGGPFSYKWLNSNPLPKIWEQMNLAYRYGADRIWIVNVGDLKPLEVPIEFFMRMAWNPDFVHNGDTSEFLKHWATRDFGPEHADAIAHLVGEYAKYNASPKPELVKPTTFSLLNYSEAERVWNKWEELAQQAQSVSDQLPADQKDAFYELVLHPVLACGTAVKLNIVAERDELFAKQGRTSTNDDFQLANHLFARDAQLTDFYNHTLANGKWEHMMDQVHLGYYAWYSPKANIEPPVSEIDVPDTSDFGVALEGMSGTQDDRGSMLPVIDSLRANKAYFEVFPVGKRPMQATVKATEPWIRLTESAAFSSGKAERRYTVDVDWAQVGPGLTKGTVIVRDGGHAVRVTVPVMKATPEQASEAKGAFGGLIGPISFNATDAMNMTPAGDVHWAQIPDYGREGSAMTIFPVTAASIPQGREAPTMEYDIFVAKPGEYHIDLVTNPTLDLYPGRALSVGVSVDSKHLQVKSVYTPATSQAETFLGKNFYRNTETNARLLQFTQTIDKAGRHKLQIVMVDPTVVVEKVIVYQGELPYSFFGPPAVEKTR